MVVITHLTVPVFAMDEGQSGRARVKTCHPVSTFVCTRHMLGGMSLTLSPLPINFEGAPLSRGFRNPLIDMRSS